jgi:hypothetical protein
MPLGRRGALLFLFVLVLVLLVGLGLRQHARAAPLDHLGVGEAADAAREGEGAQEGCVTGARHWVGPEKDWRFEA